MRAPAHVALLACLALALPMTARSQQSATATSEGEQILRELVQVMNAGDRTSLRRLVDERFVVEGAGAVPPEQRVERLSNLRAAFGRHTLRSVDASKPREVLGLVQSERTESWRRMTVFLNETSPARILRVGFAPAPAPDAPARRPSDAELVAQLKGYVERLASRDAFSGDGAPREGRQAALPGGVRRGEQGLRRAEHARHEVQPRLDEQDVHGGRRSRSSSSRGSSRSTTRSRSSSPTARDADVRQKVRIKHLLTHTSGLGSYFNDEFDRPSRARFRSVDDMDARSPRTSRWRSSRARAGRTATPGMLVLGKVIEVVDGQDYFDYVREHVSKPAGMTNTDAYELDRVNKNLAVGYERECADDGTGSLPQQHLPCTSSAAGRRAAATRRSRTCCGSPRRSSAGSWSRAATCELLTTPKPDLSSPAYGYGFGVDRGRQDRRAQRRLPGDQLATSTSSSATATWPVVMSNYGGGAQPVVEKARSLILAGQGRTASR